MSEYIRLAGLGLIYLLYGCAILGCIAVTYGLLKLALWNIVRTRWFKDKG